MFDFEALRKDLREDEKLGALVICEETKTDILTDDFDCRRYINYHLVSPTRKWLQSLFYFPQDCKQDEPAFLNRCLDILMAADPTRLLELAQADRDGLAQIFPCKVYDTVWFVPNRNGKPEVIETHVEKLVVKNSGVYLKLACNAMYETSAKSIGKTIFFSKPEAENAAACQKRG